MEVIYEYHFNAMAKSADATTDDSDVRTLEKKMAPQIIQSHSCASRSHGNIKRRCLLAGNRA